MSICDFFCKEKDIAMADYNSILEQIEDWSLFEIYRLRVALENILDNPARQLAIKNKLKPGMEVDFFCSRANASIPAKIIEVKKSWALIKSINDGKLWDTRLYTFNLAGIDTSIKPKRNTGRLDKNSLKVGDRVGWHSKLGYDLFGVVKKLNPKRALVALPDGVIWSVGYSLLFLIMDNSCKHNELSHIEGEILGRE